MIMVLLRLDISKIIQRIQLPTWQIPISISGIFAKLIFNTLQALLELCNYKCQQQMHLLIDVNPVNTKQINQINFFPRQDLKMDFQILIFKMHGETDFLSAKIQFAIFPNHFLISTFFSSLKIAAFDRFATTLGPSINHVDMVEGGFAKCPYYYISFIK